MTHPAAIPFLNPSFLWACGGLALIPIIIYILNRQRHRKVPWAAMRFLLAANRKTMRRTRLEQLLLMITRVALLTLLGLAMARPFMPFGAAPAPLTKGTNHIFILDNSFSMAVVHNQLPEQLAAERSEPGAPTGAGRTAFDTQVQQARMLLQEIPSQDPVTFITLGYPAQKLNRQPIFDRALAGRLLQTIEQGHAHTDLLGAFRLAQQQIEAQKRERPQQAVYLFSDFAKAAFQPAPPPARSSHPNTHPARGSPDSALPAQPTEGGTPSTIKALAQEIVAHARLVLYDVYDGQTANLANTELFLASNLLGTGQPCEIRNTITNFSTRRSPNCKIRVVVDGKPMRELALDPLEAGASRTLSHSFEFRTPGLHTVETTLEVGSGNVLPLDDSRRLVVEVRKEIPLLIVDGKPGASRLRGHAGYLAAALAPPTDAQQANALLAPTVITEAELATQELSRSELVVLCNVRHLHEQNARRIEEFVLAGGGLIIFLGDLVDIDEYNTIGQALMPARLIEMAFADLSEEDFVRYDPQTVSEPLLADFGGRGNSGLFRARIHQYIRMATKLGTGRVLLAYTNGEPAIVERRVGAGRCFLVNTTANMDWTNLPAKGDFVTLVMNLVQAAGPGNARRRNYTVAEMFAQDVGTDIGGGEDYHIRYPDGNEVRLDIVSRSGGYQLQFDHLDRAGWYRLRTPELGGPLGVNLNSAESDLTALSEDHIRRELECDLEYVAVAHSDKQLAATPRSELAAILIYAVLLLLLAETLLALWFDHERR